MNAAAVPVLMYHHVSPNPGLVTVSPDNFRAQMRWLAEHGWHSLTSREFELFLEGKPVPKKSILLTFDDGYLDNYVHAYPVLKELGLRAIIFAVTGWIGEGAPRSHAGQRGAVLPSCPDHKTCKRAIAEGRADEAMLRWSEIERMEADGVVEVHSHTHSHVRWDLLQPDPTRSEAALRDDLARSQEVLAARLNRLTPHLCWPWGLVRPGYELAAEKLGFRYRYTTQFGTVTASTHSGEIPRLSSRNRGAFWIARAAYSAIHPRFLRFYAYLRALGSRNLHPSTAL